MDALARIIEESRKSPDRLFQDAFRAFQSLLAPLKQPSACKLQLPSYLPESAYSDRQVLGLLISAALMAMLDHELKTGGEKIAPDQLLTYIGLMTPEMQAGFDDIIVEQAEIIGAGLFASDLALSRFLQWQRYDYARFSRALKALDKAARIYQRRTATPLTDPFLAEVKQRALLELRPVLKKLQEEFKARRRQPTKDEILKAFEREVTNPALPHLGNSHNLQLWLEFLRRDPLVVLSASPAELFDDFQAFVSSHSSDYTRRKVSSRK